MKTLKNLESLKKQLKNNYQVIAALVLTFFVLFILHENMDLSYAVNYILSFMGFFSAVAAIIASLRTIDVGVEIRKLKKQNKKE